MQALERHLEWPGCFNVRDLGGLRGSHGVVRRGAFVRADSLADLSETGWAALWDRGVRTVVDLRNAAEITGDAAARPPGLATVHRPLDGSDDREFWDVWEAGPQFGTPLYYGPHLERFADRSVAVLRAIAEAAPGGVAFHCVGGRDRSGQIAMLLLSVLGVGAGDIAGDYDLTAARLTARYAARGEPDQGPELAAYLEEQGTSARGVLMALLAAPGWLEPLQAAGLDPELVAALRARGLDPLGSELPAGGVADSGP